MVPLTVYGVPLSQPFRSVVWTLLIKKKPFEIKLCVPGANNRLGTLHESFRKLTCGKTKTVPVLQVNDDDNEKGGGGGFALSEAPAILSYLCEKYHWSELYGPPGTTEKANIDSYMHWHHSNTRKLAGLLAPSLRPELKLTITDEIRENASNALSALEDDWLSSSLFLADRAHVSIADILAYEEVVQTTMTDVVTLADFPNLDAWTARMRQLPFHDEAHASLKALGSMSQTSEKPIMSRLGAATKEGLRAIQIAQEKIADELEP
jgi:glutathione S-transferase